MSELIRVALASLQRAWRQILAVHLVYSGLGFIVFAPLLGVLGQLLLKSSGQPALADMDLLLSARAIGDLTRLDADFLAINMAMARPALIKSAHATGKKLYVWTVNDALAMSQMMSLGVDGIITDEPLLGREVLARRAELNSAERVLLHMAPLLGVKAPSLSIESNDAESDSVQLGARD